MTDTLETTGYPIRLHEAAPIGQAIRFHVVKYWEHLSPSHTASLLATSDHVMQRRNQAQTSSVAVNTAEQQSLGDYATMLREYAAGLVAGQVAAVELNPEIEAHMAEQLALRMENDEGQLGSGV